MGRKKGDIRRPYDGFNIKVRPSAFAKLSALQESLSLQAGRPLAKTEVIEMAMDLIGRLVLENDDDNHAIPEPLELWTGDQVVSAMGISRQKWASMLRRHEIAPREYDADGNPLFNIRGISVAFTEEPAKVSKRMAELLVKEAVR